MGTTYGNINLDGNLNDWTSQDRLDLPGTGQAGYELYGKYTGDAYVFAIKSDSTAIGTGTTLWLNTDQNASTGYQIFGWTGGAEYNVNFGTDGTPALYTGADGQNLVSGPLDYATGNNSQVVEVAVPVSLLSGAPKAVDVLADVNNQVFLPIDYSLYKYTVSNTTTTPIPARTDLSKKVGIVYSETTANKFFDKKAYSQLFMSMQNQAMMAGIPFDLLKEDDLTDINKVVNYDALIFPSFRNVPIAKLGAIENTLKQAVYQGGISLITAGDFLSNDENGNPLPGDPYQRMKQLLDIQRTGGMGPVNSIVKAADITHPAMQGYSANEQITTYNNTYFSTWAGVSKTPTVLATEEVNGQAYNAVFATQTGGRNLYFANEALLGDTNLLWQGLQWSVLNDKPKVGLHLSRNNSLFISRNDMDQSMYQEEVKLVDVPLYNILADWKKNYNFVGSYYINVGNNQAQGEYTDWTVSGPLYKKYIALGNEIGTHSYTHPDNTNILTPTQLEFEFNQSKAVIEKNLGNKVLGAAIPGAPEGLSVPQELQKYFPYITGGYSGVGAGYPNAFGFLTPDYKMVYFSPNITFDFTRIEFQKMTAAQTEIEWAKEYNSVINHASNPIIHWPWHDYGPTQYIPGYTKDMFTNFIARAYKDNTEFATLADVEQRINTFDKTQLFVDGTGDTITAKVASSDDVGKFSLSVNSNANSNKVIKNVQNWYAYDGDNVFLPKAGGTFNINLGTAADDVSHIVNLPMRSDLLSVTGDGKNLQFSFIGDGKVTVDLNSPAMLTNSINVSGADGKTINGDIVELNFKGSGQHNTTISWKTITDPLTGYTLSNTTSTLPTLNANTIQVGTGKVDTLTGINGTKDNFILGTSTGVSYNKNTVNITSTTNNAYAVITNFKPAEGDIIQLYGQAANYVLANTPTNLPGGDGIYWHDTTTGVNKLIGIVQGDVANLNLLNKSFVYVS